jgi:hypothetical protein
MRSLIKDLTYEIEILQLEIDSTDENNNCNIEVSDKVFNTKTFGRGTAYNYRRLHHSHKKHTFVLFLH